MPYTPVELRHVKLGRSLLGFSREETERLLGDVADSFEEVWRERGELSDRVEDLEKRLEEVRQREALLASTLVSAEKAAAEAKDAAKREAELIVAEAHGEARSIMRAAQSERERLFGEARRVEALLRAALGIVAEGAEPVGAAPAAEAASQPPAEVWPRREDTREFQIVGSNEAASEPAPPTGAESQPEQRTAEPAAEPEPAPQAEAAAEEEPVEPQPAQLPPPSMPEQPAPREFAWGD
jgi:cell division initiation protein